MSPERDRPGDAGGVVRLAARAPPAAVHVDDERRAGVVGVVEIQRQRAAAHLGVDEIAFDRHVPSRWDESTGASARVRPSVAYG
jgi:hypothetical protein